jgi:hypothetical protein
MPSPKAIALKLNPGGAGDDHHLGAQNTFLQFPEFFNIV